MVQRCIQETRQGGELAFRGLMERYRERLSIFIHPKIGNWEDTEEVVQDTFVAVHKRIDQFAGRSEFKTWLFSIARNKSSDRIREICGRRQRDREIERELALRSGWDGPEPGERVTRSGFREVYGSCLSQLRERERKILILRFDEELSLMEIAAVFEIGLSAVKMRLARAMRAFRKVYHLDRLR
ncbi:MAG TPA: RNA polymerase sigma factor [Verrucomicrobiales bacterium]|nr:RNA polymerase sigma factor [Verrucomicrobiales bacterium]